MTATKTLLTYTAVHDILYIQYMIYCISYRFEFATSKLETCFNLETFCFVIKIDE